eukprot:4532498-Prymnesium_polylepis.2
MGFAKLGHHTEHPNCPRVMVSLQGFMIIKGEQIAGHSVDAGPSVVLRAGVVSEAEVRNVRQ